MMLDVLGMKCQEFVHFENQLLGISMISMGNTYGTGIMQGEMVTLCGEDHMENGWE